MNWIVGLKERDVTDWIPIWALCISLLALFTSILSLFVHYSNQMERRHGEISTLRSDFLRTMSGAEHRLASIQMHLEYAILELRRLPNFESKDAFIEMLQKHMDAIKGAEKLHHYCHERLEKIETMNHNTSKNLILLQSMNHDIYNSESICSKIEQDVLDFLAAIRAVQEEADKQQTEPLGKPQQPG